MKPLTPRQQRFVEEYLVDLNATQAATRAGYSARTANEQGARLLAHVSVRSHIEAAKAERSHKTQITAERVLQERARLAFLDIGKAANARLSGPQDIAALPDDVRASVTGWKWDRQGNFVVEFADKNPSLTALERHLGMYRDETPPVAVFNINLHLG